MDRLADAPIGTKAPAFIGGHWIKVERGWKWHCGDTFPRPGGDWDGRLIYPDGSVSKRPAISAADLLAATERNGASAFDKTGGGRFS